jgi:hypothetical protein
MLQAQRLLRGGESLDEPARILDVGRESCRSWLGLPPTLVLGGEMMDHGFSQSGRCGGERAGS